VLYNSQSWKRGNIHSRRGLWSAQEALQSGYEARVIHAMFEHTAFCKVFGCIQL
jgi:hypothetical protein